MIDVPQSAIYIPITSPFACPANFSYLSFADLVVNLVNSTDIICHNQTLFPQFGDSKRLQGGGVAYSLGICNFDQLDYRNYTDALCGQTLLTDLRVFPTDGCPVDSMAIPASNLPEDGKSYDAVSFDEAVSQIDTLCPLLANGTTRISFRGSVDKQESQCVVNRWDNRNLSQTLCTQRLIQDALTVDSHEVVCPENFTIVTEEEVLLNVAGYCSLVPSEGAARLAGGASLQRTMDGCEVLNEDRRTLAGALCADYYQRERIIAKVYMELIPIE